MTNVLPVADGSDLSNASENRTPGQSDGSLRQVTEFLSNTNFELDDLSSPKLQETLGKLLPGKEIGSEAGLGNIASDPPVPCIEIKPIAGDEDGIKPPTTNHIQSNAKSVASSKPAMSFNNYDASNWLPIMPRVALPIIAKPRKTRAKPKKKVRVHFSSPGQVFEVKEKGLIKMHRGKDKLCTCGLVFTFQKWAHEKDPKFRGTFKKYKCNFCKYEYMTLEGLEKHLSEHFLACPECDLRFFQRYSYLKHIRSHHPERHKEVAGYIAITNNETPETPSSPGEPSKSPDPQAITTPVKEQKQKGDMMSILPTPSTGPNPLMMLTPSPGAVKNKGPPTTGYSSIPVLQSTKGTNPSNQMKAFSLLPTSSQAGMSSHSVRLPVSSAGQVMLLVPTSNAPKSSQKCLSISSTAQHRVSSGTAVSMDHCYSPALASVSATATTPSTPPASATALTSLARKLSQKEAVVGKNYFTYRVSTKPGGDTEYGCDICSYTSPTMKEIYSHAGTHTAEDFKKMSENNIIWQCFYCAYNAAVQEQVVNHVVEVHHGKAVHLKRFQSNTVEVPSIDRKDGSQVLNDESRQSASASKEDPLVMWGCFYCTFASNDRCKAVQHVKQRHPTEKLIITRADSSVPPSAIKQLPPSRVGDKILLPVTSKADSGSEKYVEVPLVQMPNAPQVFNAVTQQDALHRKPRATSRADVPASAAWTRNFVQDMESTEAVDQTLNMLMGNYADDFGPEGESKDQAKQSSKDGAANKQKKENICNEIQKDYGYIDTPELYDYDRKTKLGWCKQCNALFTGSNSLVRLKEHVLSHTGLKIWGCPYCDFQVNDKEKIKSHVPESHPNEDYQIIRLLPYASELSGEVDPLDPDSDPAVWAKARPSCPRFVREASALKRAKTVWQCPFCNRRSVFKGTIVIHLKLVHPEKYDKKEIQRWARPQTPRTATKHRNTKAVVRLVRLEDMEKYPVLQDILEEDHNVLLRDLDQEEDRLQQWLCDLEEMRYQCSSCPYRAPKASKVRSHMLEAHTGTEAIMHYLSHSGQDPTIYFCQHESCLFTSSDAQLLGKHLDRRPEHIVNLEALPAVVKNILEDETIEIFLEAKSDGDSEGDKSDQSKDEKMEDHLYSAKQPSYKAYSVRTRSKAVRIPSSEHSSGNNADQHDKKVQPSYAPDVKPVHGSTEEYSKTGRKKRRVRTWQGENESGWNMFGVRLSCRSCKFGEWEGVSASVMKAHIAMCHPYNEPICRDIKNFNHKQSHVVRMCIEPDCEFATYFKTHYDYHMFKEHAKGKLSQEPDKAMFIRSTEELIVKERENKACDKSSPEDSDPDFNPHMTKSPKKKRKRRSTQELRESQKTSTASEETSISHTQSLVFENTQQHGWSKLPQYRYICTKPCKHSFATMDIMRNHLLLTGHGRLGIGGYACTDTLKQKQKQRKTLLFCKRPECAKFFSYSTEQFAAHVLLHPESKDDASDDSNSGHQSESHNRRVDSGKDGIPYISDIEIKKEPVDLIYQCSHCNEILTNAVSVKQHVKDVHDIEEGGFTEIALTEDGNWLIQMKGEMKEEAEDGNFSSDRDKEGSREDSNGMQSDCATPPPVLSKVKTDQGKNTRKSRLTFQDNFNSDENDFHDDDSSYHPTSSGESSSDEGQERSESSDDPDCEGAQANAPEDPPVLTKEDSFQ